VNGTLSGSNQYASCSVAAAASCTFNGQSVANGAFVTAYQSSSVAYGSQCLSEQRTCSNGSLSGSYANSSCSVGAAQSCTFNDQTISNGQSVTAYQASSVANGQTCTSQSRICSNGTLSGSYLNASCVIVPPPTPPLPTPSHTPLVGIYYFGIWSPAMYRDSTVPPNNEVPVGTIASPAWWAGVADFYQQTGAAYNIWKQRTPNLLDFSNLKPQIGYYDLSNVTAVEQHIDQAAAASIDFFNFYWYWNPHTHAEAYADGLKSFRVASNKSKMRFTVSIYTSTNPDVQIPTSDVPLAQLGRFACGFRILRFLSH
jgi:hypothetical protein